MKGFYRITGRQNRQLVFARRVRDGREPSHIFVEGARLAAEALRSGLDIERCFVSDSAAVSGRSAGLLGDLALLDSERFIIADPAFGSLADTKNSQGIILVAKRPDHGIEAIIHSHSAARAPLFIYLYSVNDPSNLGAVLRTAEAAGAAGVFTSEGSADAFSPKALRASMGSAFRLSVGERVRIEDAAAWARENSIVIAAADVAGERIYTEVDLDRPMLIIFGSEAHGLDARVLGLADVVFRIPLMNGVESLNLAVSAGVVLFEAARQRG